MTNEKMTKNKKMIQESTIDQILEKFENQAVDFEIAVRDFGERQPAVLSFLMSDSEGVISEDEQDFMLYLATVIFSAVEKEIEDLPTLQPDEIAEAEEANWALMEMTKGKPFRERLNLFFDDYPQEDLLAFVEDALAGEAEDMDGETFSLTPESQEPMFVSLKTVIDVLTADVG